MKIAVAGTGYVGLSMAVLLAQHNTVVAVDILQDKGYLFVTVEELFYYKGVEAVPGVVYHSSYN